MARSTLLVFIVLALQALHFWDFASPQVPGFVSIDCGSDAAQDYTDAYSIVWKADADLIKEGKSLPVTGGTNHVISNMRLFDGNQSKYCYSLSSDAVVAGAFLLVRASIWPGITPPYTPANSDGYLRFMMIVDANVWQEVEVPYGDTTYYSYEFYTRAQRSTIDVCFARSSPGGDAPFVNALELRPLLSTMTTTIIMNGTGVNLVLWDRADYGVLAGMPKSFRYNDDTLDRIWISYQTTEDNVKTTNATIVTNTILDRPPAVVLQTAYMGKPALWRNYSGLDVNSKFFATLYFAEIDPAVNASGQRVFNIFANGVKLDTLEEDIDVFGSVGSNVAYEYPAVVTPNADGVLTFNVTPTATSKFPSFIAASELFYAKTSISITASGVVSVIEAIKSSSGLSTYTGDPCLPLGYGYNWLNCSGSAITALSLSNYGTGGTIAEAINNLTSLSEIHMDGNDLQGPIPDLSALTNLQVLDLSNNDLNGSIPESLATLKNLRVLNVQNNNLSGDIPAALLQRKQASTLALEFSGNPFCVTNADLGCAPPTSTQVPPGSSSPSPNDSTEKKTNMGVVIGAVVAGILAVAAAIGIIVYCLCRNKPNSIAEQPVIKHDSAGQEPHRSPQAPVLDKVIPKAMCEFTFQEIKDATDNFSTQIGKGGFGPVFKGRLQNGRLVAVKVASNASHQGSKEFINEVGLLSRIHHRNLVGFCGYCNEGKLMLVYEYMANGSLFDCLHGQYAKATPLSWLTRLRIAVDSAQGFDYLHNGCHPRIIHRDVKSSNILLNDDLEAKISDFGISRNTIVNETGAPPTALMGSMGYMDPDYLSSMKLTEKVDVYSFGVVLFEIVCGRTAVFGDSIQQIHIVEWARSYIDRGTVEDIVDPSLHGQYDISAVWKVLEIALACVQMPATARPRMNAVYLELRDAERMELENDQKNVFDKPSVEFTTGGNRDSYTYTHVSAR